METENGLHYHFNEWNKCREKMNSHSTASTLNLSLERKTSHDYNRGISIFRTIRYKLQRKREQKKRSVQLSVVRYWNNTSNSLSASQLIDKNKQNYATCFQNNDTVTLSNCNDSLLKRAKLSIKNKRKLGFKVNNLQTMQKSDEVTYPVLSFTENYVLNNDDIFSAEKCPKHHCGNIRGSNEQLHNVEMSQNESANVLRLADDDKSMVTNNQYNSLVFQCKRRLDFFRRDTNLNVSSGSDHLEKRQELITAPINNFIKTTRKKVPNVIKPNDNEIESTCNWNLNFNKRFRSEYFSQPEIFMSNNSSFCSQDTIDYELRKGAYRCSSGLNDPSNIEMTRPMEESQIRFDFYKKSASYLLKNTRRHSSNLLNMVDKPISIQPRNDDVVDNSCQLDKIQSNKDRLMIVSSPNKSGYILTPNKHIINLTQYVSEIDQSYIRGAIPALAAMSVYYEPIVQNWLVEERKLAKPVFLLCFKTGTALEQFRVLAVQSIFIYAIKYKLHEITIHSACVNISRLIYAMFIEEKNAALTQELFIFIVLAGLRCAIKYHEPFEKGDIFRTDPNHLWNCCSFFSRICTDRSYVEINKIELKLLRLLNEPNNLPMTPDFLDRYLIIGGWTDYISEYRELASYILGLVLFANTYSTKLRCISHSELAAAALILSIKVINSDVTKTKYEYWPKRLIVYTGYTLETLKPVIKGLANLLRNKPKWIE